MRRTLLVFAVLGSAAAAQPATSLNGPGLVRYQDAVAKIQAGAYGPATAQLNALAAEFPRVPEVFATRASAQMGLRHFAPAEADCVYALALRPKMASALFGLATAEEGQGKNEQAVAHYREYLALDDPQAVYKPQAAARVEVLAPSGRVALAVPPPPPPTGIEPAAPPVSSGPSGTLYIYRNHFFGGELRNVTLAIDGRVIGDIGHDQFVDVQIGAGDHLVEARFSVFSIWEVPVVLSVPVDIAPGRETFVNFDYVSGQLVLQRVPAGVGSREVKEDCHRAYSRRM